MTPHSMTAELEIRTTVAAMMTGVTPNSAPSGRAGQCGRFLARMSK